MFKQTKVWLSLTIALSVLALAAACGGNKTPDGPVETAGATKWAPKGNEGTVSGVVAFTGTPPAPKKIATDADAACGQKNPNLMTEDNMVKDGKLANVLVYIKEGSLTEGGKKVGDFTYDTPAAASTLDQNGCHYVPHVSAVMVNQKINITNSDPTQHNIHFTPTKNPDWNQSQPNGAAALTHSFKVSEILVPVKCNQHPWMKAYVGVMKHPYFAVTGEDGSFSIKGVPPGTYTVVAWHEGAGAGTEKTMQVTVAANGTAKADFSFGEGGTASTNPSLKMMPAIEFPMLGRQ